MVTSESGADGAGRPQDRRRERARQYLYSNKNIVGCLCALVGLALFLTGVIGAIWPVVVVGLYGVGALATPPPKVMNLRVGLEPADLNKAMDEQERRITGAVPPDVLTAVLQIHGGVRDVLARQENLAAGSPDAYVLEQTVLDYLPTALESYQRLPRAYANRATLTDGRTPRQILLDQLATLDRQVQELVATVARRDSDRLLANERFLADRFGPGELDVDGPPGQPNC